jgi:hypothetical protein
VVRFSDEEEASEALRVGKILVSGNTMSIQVAFRNPPINTRSTNAYDLSGLGRALPQPQDDQQR